MHLTEGVPKKEVARRLGVDVKTVRRHIQGGETYPARKDPNRTRALDAHRDQIEVLLQGNNKLSAKGIGRLLEIDHGIKVSARTVRRYVNELRGAAQKPEAFVHRTHGCTVPESIPPNLDGRSTRAEEWREWLRYRTGTVQPHGK